MFVQPLSAVRRLLPVAAAILTLLWSATALAQSTVVVNKTSIGTSFKNGRDFEPFSISYDDCIANQTFTFQVAITQPTGADLEVWIGTNCTVPTDGTLTPPAGCRRIFSDNALATMSVGIRAQEIIGNAAATAAVCEATGSDDPKKVVLFFMLLTSGDIISGHIADTWTTNYDLVGPEPPRNVTAGIGEQGIPLEWDASASDDVASYNFYCDPKAGASATSATQQAAGDAATDVGAAGTTSDAGTDGSIGSGGVGGTISATGGAGGTGGTQVSEAGASINPDCASTVVVGGQRPSKEDLCGSQGDGTQGTASKLRNGQLYTVAIAGVDLLENVGPLSAPVCGTPTEVTDFFEAYKSAGGRGGGGCSFGSSPAPSASALVLAALALRRLRRRFR